MFKKNIFILLTAVLLVISGCGAAQQKTNSISSGKNQNSAAKNKQTKGVTALEAWQKVAPKAKKWSANYKIARILDYSYANFQRQNGLSNVWKFDLEDCEKNNSLGICTKGKSRVFYYATVKGGWGNKGVSAQPENSMVTGLKTFPSDKLKIDTDQAIVLARKQLNKTESRGEEFKIESYVDKDGAVYWQIVRQCFLIKKDCNSNDNYSAYINTETGEVLTKKPRAY